MPTEFNSEGRSYRSKKRIKEIENIILVSFDLKFIRQDEKQRRTGEAWRAAIENTMLVSLYYIKFIRQDQK